VIDPPLHDGGIPLPRRYIAILAVTAATAATVVDGAVVTVALPTVARALGIAEAQSVMVVTLYQFLLALGLIPMAALGDRFGLRRVFRMGLVIFLAGTLLCWFVDSIGLLLTLRALQALGAGLLLSVGSAQIRSVYPLRILGRGLAFNSLTVSICMALSPVIGTAILANAEWPIVFVAAAPLALIALAASFALPEGAALASRFDWRSALLYFAAMALLFAALDGNLLGSFWGRGVSLIGAAYAGWLLVRRARREQRPLFPVDLLVRPLLALSICGALCAFASSMAVLVILPFRLDQFHHFTIAETGAALAAWPLATMVVAPAIGLLSDRLQPWALGAGGLAVTVLALTSLCFAADTDGPLDIAWRLALCGAGYAAYTASNARLILANSPRDRAAPVGGLIATTRILGQSIGAMITAWTLKLGWVAAPMGLAVPISLAIVGMMFSAGRRRAA